MALDTAFKPYSLDQQITCVKREIAIRIAVYPRHIKAGKLTLERAQHEVGCMVAVLETLVRTKQEQSDE